VCVHTYRLGWTVAVNNGIFSIIVTE